MTPRTPERSPFRPGLVGLALSLLVPGLAPAQDTGTSDDPRTQVVVTDQNARSQVRLAFPEIVFDSSLTGVFRDAAQEVEQTLRDDLEQALLFNVQGPTELSVLSLTGQRETDFEQYRSLGNEVVLLATLSREEQGGRLVLEGRAYDLPSQQLVLGKRFRGTREQTRLIAHTLADALHFQFLGRPGLMLTSIAFHSQRDGFQELYLMDYDGHNQRKISAHRSTSGFPSWSPVGDTIGYMSYYSGAPGIYRVELATGRKIPVYQGGNLNLSPAFSPDGRRIVFAHSSHSNVDLYLCDLECTAPEQITQSAAIDTNPAWSPDGQWISFTSSRSGRPNLYVMKPDGSNVRRISFEGDYNDGASWRFDSGQIVYASRKDNRFRIAATNLIDLETRILAQGPDSYEEPSFSPDGQRIVFTVRRGSESQVFVMNADGTGWRQLTHEGNNAGPSWGPLARN